MMESPESTKIVYSRIQKIDPDNVSKIVGYLLCQDNSEGEMIRLAQSSDVVIRNVTNKVRNELGLLSSKQSAHTAVSYQLTPGFSPFSGLSALGFRSSNVSWMSNDDQHNFDVFSSMYSNSDLVQNPVPILGSDDHLDPVSRLNSDFSNDCFYTNPQIEGLRARTGRRSVSLTDFPPKICHYYSKGYCKHGSNCRYIHENMIPDCFSPYFNAHCNENSNDDQDLLSPGSLEKLEMEITELLRSRRGGFVSIASLPMLYYEKYGKSLQAEGYLTESQRHGKAGYSLTKLLARLKTSIRLIDRPHGQHSVVLAEDVAKFLEYGVKQTDGSRQIYLTFPAESTFTEKDVFDYFNTYGPVEDVRIPCQQKRMFGFVTFFYAETVRKILMKGNPHFVCDARVLVKPYREKSRFVDRKHAERSQNFMQYGSHFMYGESDPRPAPRFYDSSRLLRRQYMEEHELALEMEMRRLAELRLGAPQQFFVGHSMDNLKLGDGETEQPEFPSSEQFCVFLDALNNDSTSEEKNQNTNSNSNYKDQESNQGLNLPDSPFASSIANTISMII